MFPLDGLTPIELDRIINNCGWCLLGIDVITGDKTYACSTCWQQRYTLITKGAKLPTHCPKCGMKNEV